MKVCLQLQALNDKIGQGGRITAVYYREGCLLDTILHMFRANAAIYLKIFPRFFFVLTSVIHVGLDVVH